jgi:hypothetical protein
MQILSQSDSKENVPALNMVVEQDDKMGTDSFTDFMEQFSLLPAYETGRSTSNGGHTSALETREQQNKMLVPQYKIEQNYEVQNYEQFGNNVNKQRLNQRKTYHEGEREVKQSTPEEELERSQREQSQRRAKWKHRERNYHQRAEVDEHSSIMGKFGQRISNLFRPTMPEFKKSKSHDILMTNSKKVFPPTASIFRNFSLIQNAPTFQETPVTRSNSISSSTVRNRPLSSNSTRPLSNPAHTISPPSTFPIGVYSEISPKAMDNSLISTDISRVSGNIDTDTDTSHVHIDIPRKYTGVSHPHADLSTSSSDISHTPQFTEFSRVRFTLPRQQPSISLSPPYFEAAEDQDNLQFSSILNESALLSELTTVSHQSLQSGDNFQHSADISPPSVNIIPPLPPLFKEQSIRNEQSQLPEQSEGHEDIFFTNNPTYVSRQNEPLNGSGGDNKEERYSDRASSVQGSSGWVARHVEDVRWEPEATADQEESRGQQGYRPYTAAGGEQQTRRKSVQQAVSSQTDPEDDYKEVRLTAAETAYYKRRQIAKKPFKILEATGEYSAGVLVLVTCNFISNLDLCCF